MYITADRENAIACYLRVMSRWLELSCHIKFREQIIRENLWDYPDNICLSETIRHCWRDGNRTHDLTVRIRRLTSYTTRPFLFPFFFFLDHKAFSCYSLLCCSPFDKKLSHYYGSNCLATWLFFQRHYFPSIDEGAIPLGWPLLFPSPPDLPYGLPSN